MTTTGPVPLSRAAVVATTVAELKPRLRGWLHTYAAAVSVVTGATLIAVTAALRTGSATAATAIYGATVTLLFGTSALYHRVAWSPAAHRRMKRLDHSMIFIFIAGTYTPIAVVSLHGAATVGVLTAVWTGAAVGVALQTLWPAAPRWLSAPCYIALGWVAIFVLPELLHNAGTAAFALLLTGGAAYTLGALVYASRRPNPVPAVFGFHEVFHACTLVGALSQYLAVWLAVF